MGKHVAPGTPTQVAHPMKAVLRTVFAYVVAVGGFLVAAIPLVQDVLGPYLPEGWGAWLAGAAALLGAVMGLVTRLMALAEAQPLLEKIGLGTGVEDEPGNRATTPGP